MVPKRADVWTFQKDQTWWYEKKEELTKDIAECAALESEHFFPLAGEQLCDMNLKEEDKELVPGPDWHFSNSAL